MRRSLGAFRSRLLHRRHLWRARPQPGRAGRAPPRSRGAHPPRRWR
ncbi:hypothetical protein ACFPRL_28865 [Pseudoclavibacter helvolus]